MLSMTPITGDGKSKQSENQSYPSEAEPSSGNRLCEGLNTFVLQDFASLHYRKYKRFGSKSDYLSWTEQFQHFAQRPRLSASERLLLLRGQATPMTLKELNRLQWKVQMHTTGR
jgi:hypothetical protein